MGEDSLSDVPSYVAKRVTRWYPIHASVAKLVDQVFKQYRLNPKFEENSTYWVIGGQFGLFLQTAWNFQNGKSLYSRKLLDLEAQVSDHMAETLSELDSTLSFPYKESYLSPLADITFKQFKNWVAKGQVTADKQKFSAVDVLTHRCQRNDRHSKGPENEIRQLLRLLMTPEELLPETIKGQYAPLAFDQYLIDTFEEEITNYLDGKPKTSELRLAQAYILAKKRARERIQDIFNKHAIPEITAAAIKPSIEEGITASRGPLPQRVLQGETHKSFMKLLEEMIFHQGERADSQTLYEAVKSSLNVSFNFEQWHKYFDSFRDEVTNELQTQWASGGVSTNDISEALESSADDILKKAKERRNSDTFPENFQKFLFLISYIKRCLQRFSCGQFFWPRLTMIHAVDIFRQADVQRKNKARLSSENNYKELNQATLGQDRLENRTNQLAGSWWPNISKGLYEDEINKAEEPNPKPES